MRRHSVVQFLPPARPAVTRRVLSRIAAAGAQAVLDLEDGVQDPLRPERTASLRRRARSAVLALGRMPGAPLSRMRVGVRVNGLGTPDLLEDIEALAALRELVSWASVVVPKVEDSSAVARMEALLRRHGVAFGELIPTIETVAGVRNLREILSGRAGRPFRTVQFGHYDYNLDAGHWPFLDQRSGELWDVVSPMIREIESRGLRYSHTPYGDLDGDEVLRMILAHLDRLCRRPFSIVTLSLRQSRVCAGPVGAGSGELVRRAGFTEREKEQLAERTIELFRSERCRERSFSLVRGSSRFIAPHEYWGAIRFLRARERTVV